MFSYIQPKILPLQSSFLFLDQSKRLQEHELLLINVLDLVGGSITDVLSIQEPFLAVGRQFHSIKDFSRFYFICLVGLDFLYAICSTWVEIFLRILCRVVITRFVVKRMFNWKKGHKWMNLKRYIKFKEAATGGVLLKSFQLCMKETSE